jgi:hypothetical protein
MRSLRSAAEGAPSLSCAAFMASSWAWIRAADGSAGSLKLIGMIDFSLVFNDSSKRLGTKAPLR